MSNTDALYVYVDMDDTLIRSAGGTRIRIPAVVNHVRSLFKAGAVLYCWSAGGADCITVHPASCDSATLTDYRRRVDGQS